MAKFAELEILKTIGGYYECPKDGSGRRLGPLVGYAGRDENGKQFVGDIYVNFAKAEERPSILHTFAACITTLERFRKIELIDVFLGAPEGGKALAFMLAYLSGCRYIFPEKKTIQLADKNSREKSEFVFGRHSLSPCDRPERVIIVEDVLNNFSTTEELVELVENNGGVVIAIVAFLNRSLRDIRDRYIYKNKEIPVMSLVDLPIPQYRQDDPEVCGDVSFGNVIWKPKDSWPRLEEAMKKNKT